MLTRTEAVRKINLLSSAGTPFYFFTDFLGHRSWVGTPKEASAHNIQISIGATKPAGKNSEKILFHKTPLSFDQYKESFDQVIHEIKMGNSFLVNLTFQTPIKTSLSLKEVFLKSNAPYKLLVMDQFVVFSPETFITIEDGNIHSYPMKGTIDASIPSAEEIILKDKKETAEHVTIVDLIRNDLSLVAEKVEVSKFRFISEVQTHEKKLLQVSSEVRGQIKEEYKNSLGSLIYELLPAGSITGAPKSKTVDIIQKAESYDRGFYTGICGMFDGRKLDCGVMIRFIENKDGQLYFKSGGGITSFSDPKKEYQEIIDKIYVPIH